MNDVASRSEMLKPLRRVFDMEPVTAECIRCGEPSGGGRAVLSRFEGAADIREQDEYAMCESCCRVLFDFVAKRMAQAQQKRVANV